jgi:hypothetical protein
MKYLFTVPISNQPPPMGKNFKVILFIESLRASGRDYLRGTARYAHLHGSWSFYWEPGGFEITRQKLKTLDADGIMLRDVGGLKAQALHMGILAVVLGHRDRAGIPLAVNEVARNGGHFAPRLGAPFPAATGRLSILKEIRRQRTDQIARLLLETSLPVARIGESLGFDGAQHFTRYFRTAKKMSPLAFRKTGGGQSVESVPSAVTTAPASHAGN